MVGEMKAGRHAVVNLRAVQKRGGVHSDTFDNTGGENSFAIHNLVFL